MAQVFKNPIVQSDAMLKNGEQPRGYIKPANNIDLDIDKFDEVYKKASKDFPNDWGNKMDYIRQEMGIKIPETVSDVWYKNGSLYGLQTDAEKEPYEIELYGVNPRHNGLLYARNKEEEKMLRDRLSNVDAEFELDAKKYPDVTKTPYGFIYNVNNKSITDLAGGKKKLGYSLSNNDSGFTVADGGEEVFFKDFDSAYKYAKGGK